MKEKGVKAMTALQTVQQTDIRTEMEGIEDNYGKGQIQRFFKYLDDTNQVVNEESITSYFKWLSWESGYRARTINGYRSAVRSRLRAVMIDADLNTFRDIETFLKRLDRDPMTKPKKINNDGVKKRHCLTRAQISELIDVAWTVPQKLFIRALFVTGLRVTELLTIEHRHCTVLGDKVEIVINGKGGKERTVVAPLSLIEAINDHYQGKKYLLETERGTVLNRHYVSNEITKVGKKAGYIISAHSLRHSFATYHIKNTPNKIGAVSKFLGHSSVSTTVSFYDANRMDDDEILSADII